LQVKQKVKGAVTICSISGEIPIDTVEDLKKKFKKLVTDKTRKVILNFKDLDYIDSAGLASLIQFSKDLKGIQGAVFFSNLSPKIISLFAITKLENAFPIYETEEAAVSDFYGY